MSARREYAHPNVSVMIDPVARFLHTRHLSLAAIGRLSVEMDRALLEGRWEEVSALPYIGKICLEPLGGRRAISPRMRADVLAEGSCRACGSQDNPEVDHIVPWSRGGTDERENLQRLCASCNNSKRAKTMEEWLACK